MTPICLSVRREGDDAPEATYRFDQREVVIGRSGEVDLCLDDPSVSLVHLRLLRRKDALLVIDVDSANGSWLDGARLPAGRPRTLAVGSRLHVGRFTLACIDPAEAVPASTASVARQAVRAMVDEGRLPPRLEVVGGPNRGLVADLPALDSSAPLIVGRTADCGLVLTDADVSREHLEIRCEGGSLFVRDLGSKNGFFHREQRIVDGVGLADGDELRVGASRLRVVVPSHAPASSTEQPTTTSAEHSPPAGAEQRPAVRGSTGRPTTGRPTPWWRDSTLVVAGVVIALVVAGAITYLAW